MRHTHEMILTWPRQRLRLMVCTERHSDKIVHKRRFSLEVCYLCDAPDDSAAATSNRILFSYIRVQTV